MREETVLCGAAGADRRMLSTLNTLDSEVVQLRQELAVTHEQLHQLASLEAIRPLTSCEQERARQLRVESGRIRHLLATLWLQEDARSAALRPY